MPIKKILSFLIYMIFSVIFCTLSICQETNLIINNGFEDMENGFPLYWNGNKINSISHEAYSGSNSLELNSITNEFIEFEQTFDIDSSRRLITLSAFIKVDNVISGNNSLDQARIILTFLSDNGLPIDYYPELGSWEGTYNWFYKQKTFEIPDNAKKCRLSIILSNCNGSIKIDDVELIYGKIKRNYNAENLLNNGGFEFGDILPEDWDFWCYGASQFISPGNLSKKCYYLNSKSAGYSHVSQKIEIDPLKVKYIEVRADYKIRNIIPGQNQWNKTRIIIEFYNEQNQLINGNRNVLEEAQGTILNWKTISKWLVIPEEAKSLKFIIDIFNTTGELWIDNCIIRGFDGYGNTILKEIPEPIDYTNWYKFNYQETNTAVWPDIDISFLLDAPAGKHGFIQNCNGETYFEDGTRARFWGTNISINNEKMTYEYSIKTAHRLASIGCNMVRLHLDLPDNENFDRLDFFIYQLIQRGIYIYLDITYHKYYGEADGLIHNDKDLPIGLVIVSYFDEQLISFEKEHAYRILNHYNPYLKKIYIDEPGLIALEMLNESSVFYIDRICGFSDKYKTTLDILFNNWLTEKYQTHEIMISSWDRSGDIILYPEENLSNKNIKRAALEYYYFDNWLNNGKSPDCTGRASDTKRFYCDLQSKYYQEMYQYIRSIGFKGLITGSNNWERFDGDIYSNSQLDHIDFHSYFDHPDPATGFGPMDIIFQNNEVLKTLQNNITGIASVKIEQNPIFITEWGIPYPNESRYAGPVMMASYSCLQNWDAVLQFCFIKDHWNYKIDHIFDISISPMILSQWIPAAFIFHKMYIKKSRLKFTDEIGQDNMFDTNEHSFRYVGNDLSLPLISRVRKRYTDNETSVFDDPSAILQQYHDVENGIITSDTNELKWNYHDGYLKIDSEYIQGIIGNFAESEIDFLDVIIHPYVLQGSILIFSMDGKPIAESEKMLLVTSGRELNQDTEFNITNSRLISNGFSPVCLEPVLGRLDFKNRTNLKVDFFDITGKKTSWIADLDDYNNQVLFFKEAETMFYEITVK